MITQSQKLLFTQPSPNHLIKFSFLKVKIFFTLGPLGVRVRCLNRTNYNEDDSDDDDETVTQKKVCFHRNVNNLVWILG